MRFAIHAYEDIYGGYHGIETTHVDDYDSFEAACEDALDLSIQVIYDYCEDEYIQMAEDAGEDEDDYMREHAEYEVFPLNEKANKCSLDKLQEKFYNDRESFLSEYQAIQEKE